MYDHIHACTAAYRLAILANAPEANPASPAASSGRGTGISTNGGSSSSSSSGRGMPAAAASAKADITSVMLRDIVAAAGRHMFSLSGEPDAAATLLWSLAQLGHTGYRERGQGGSAVESLVHVVATAAAAQHRAGAGTTHASPTTDGQPHELTSECRGSVQQDR